MGVENVLPRSTMVSNDGDVGKRLENGIDGTITVFVDKLDESVRRWKV
jgi:hypothetical protein